VEAAEDAVVAAVRLRVAAAVAESRAFLRDVPRAAAPIHRISRTFRKDAP
jgi:hypothetical protein